jgi:hypothetical protein
MKKVIVFTCPFLLMALLACGAGTPPPAEAHDPAAMTPPESEAPPAADAQQDAAAPNVEEPKEASKPAGTMAVYDTPTAPVTVGLDGAVIRIGNGPELRIPSGSMRSACNVLFVVDKKNRGHRGKLGDVYTIEVQVPEQQNPAGEARPSRPEPTGADSFVLKLPLPAGKESASLAVESVEVDAKGRGRSKWTVVAMSKVEPADDGKCAVFEMANLTDAHVHLTTERAAAAP